MLLHFKGAKLPRKVRTPELGKTDEAAFHKRLSQAIADVIVSTKVAGVPPFDARDPVSAELADDIATMVLGKSVVFTLDRELSDPERQSAKAFIAAVMRVTSTIGEAHFEAAISKLAEVLLPDELQSARGLLAADNVELRDRFVREVPLLSSTQVGELSGSSAKNSYATAARWKKNGEIISVSWRGAEHFPAFQFAEGRPHPAIKRVLAALPETMTAWQKALWFVSSNGWLDDDEPVEYLMEPEKLEAAARREREEVIG